VRKNAGRESILEERMKLCKTLDWRLELQCLRKRPLKKSSAPPDSQSPSALACPLLLCHAGAESHRVRALAGRAPVLAPLPVPVPGPAHDWPGGPGGRAARGPAPGTPSMGGPLVHRSASSSRMAAAASAVRTLEGPLEHAALDRGGASIAEVSDYGELCLCTSTFLVRRTRVCVVVSLIIMVGQ